MYTFQASWCWYSPDINSIFLEKVQNHQLWNEKYAKDKQIRDLTDVPPHIPAVITHSGLAAEDNASRELDSFFEKNMANDCEDTFLDTNIFKFNFKALKWKSFPIKLYLHWHTATK